MITLGSATSERIRLARASGVGLLDMFVSYRPTSTLIGICLRDGHEALGQVRLCLHRATPQARVREARDVMVAAAESGKCRDVASYQAFLGDLRDAVHAKNLKDGLVKPTVKERAAQKRREAERVKAQKVAAVLARQKPDMTKVREFLYSRAG